jgi:hypothetical protein
VAVPEIVTEERATTVPPEAGKVIVDRGGVASVEAVAGTRPVCSVAGCTSISARRFTVACCILISVGVPEIE